MVKKIFVSYARRDHETVAALIGDLRECGHQPFFDDGLVGGDIWWDELLGQIEACEIFMPVLSGSYLESVPCRAEAEYASALAKSFLPVRVEEVSPRLCPPRIAEAQWVSYDSEQRTPILSLMRGLNAAVNFSSLPDPMPPRPIVPISYLNELKGKIDGTAEMHRSDQILLLADLKSRLDCDDSAEVVVLLRRLRARPDLLEHVARELDSLDLRDRSSSGSGRSSLGIPVRNQKSVSKSGGTGSGSRAKSEAITLANVKLRGRSSRASAMSRRKAASQGSSPQNVTRHVPVDPPSESPKPPLRSNLSRHNPSRADERRFHALIGGRWNSRRSIVSISVVAVVSLIIWQSLHIFYFNPKSASDSATSGSTNTRVDAAPVATFPPGSTMEIIQRKGKITIGTKFDQPLFGLKALSGPPEGFDVEIAKLVATAIFGTNTSGKTEFVETPSILREQSIIDGRVDLVAATYAILESRKEKVGFAGPYYVAGQSILAKKDNTVITGLDSLTGKKVCTVIGSTPLKTLQARAQGADLSILFDTYSKCIEALKDGRVEAVSTDNVILLALIKDNPGLFKLVGDTFTVEPYGIGVKKEDTVFRNFVNDTLDKAYKDGSWARAFETQVGKPTETPTPTPPPVNRY